MELIVLVDNTLSNDQLPHLCDTLTKCQNRFRIIIQESPFETQIDENGEIDPDLNFLELQKRDEFSNGSWYLLLSRDRMKNNYFGWFAGNLYLYSFNSWEYYTAVSTDAGALHAIVKTVLWAALPEHGHHGETRGCLYDFVENKSEIDVGIRRCALCNDCSRVFREKMDADDFSAILDMLDFVAFFASTGRLPRRTEVSDDTVQNLPFVPRNARHYNPSRDQITKLEEAYQALRASREPDTSSKLKGESLEKFSNRLFGYIDGFELYRSNVRLPTCEVDLSFKVEGALSDLHQALSPVIFVECKNLSSSAGVEQVSHHIMNLAEHKLKAGIFVSTGGISGYDPSRRNIQDSLGKIVSAYRQFDILVLPIVWDDIEALRNGLNLYEMLDQKRMEIIHY